MKQRFFLLVVAAVLAACSTTGPTSPQNEAQSDNRTPFECVDPFIGTGGHGHTYPGATAPFGMVQLSPDTRLDGWDGCGGYHYSDSLIYGFSHTHLQGTGVSDYGDILFAPTNSSLREADNWHDRYKSAFSHESESAEPGYYAVHLNDHNLDVELTTTPRVGIHRYHLNNPKDSLTLFIDMEHRDEIITYDVRAQGDSMIIGYRISSNWAERQFVYFAAQFSEPFEWRDQTYEVTNRIERADGTVSQEIEYVPVFPLVFPEGMQDLTVKVGLSTVSEQNAYENLYYEAPHWDFDRYRAAAKTRWEEQLGKVLVEGGTPDQRTNFYTALYHSNTVPNLISDYNGAYRGTDLRPHEGDGRDHYTVFSLWDTFRTTHPQFTLTEPERTLDFIHTFLDQYDKGGQLPVWELSANYTGCMIGYHAVPVIVDAYFKGMDDFDHAKALEAMVAIAEADELGKRAFEAHGYIPSEAEHESVSKGLEYAYDDWCIARYAEALGETEIAARFYDRASNYRNIINPASGFAEPRNNGGWTDTFDPYEVNFNFTEANSYQYSFFVPHDIGGLIDHVNGPARFEKLLDGLFSASSETTGREQADITGLLGQYAHGNEPSHHMAWLYHYLGKPWKSTQVVQRILNELYRPTPDGLCGNEDCGQMSSWYVMSAMGLYPVNPAAPEYVLGAPLFDRVTIHPESEHPLVIETEGAGSPYVQSVTWNGEKHTPSWITHADLDGGGTLRVKLSEKRITSWGAQAADIPVSVMEQSGLVAPVIEMPRISAQEQRKAVISVPDKNTEIWAAVKPGLQATFSPEDFSKYSEPLVFSGDVTVEAYAKHGDRIGKRVRALGQYHPRTLRIDVLSDYDNQYPASGEEALIDGLRGGDDFRTGIWQGYWGKDVEIMLELPAVQPVRKVSLGCLQDVKPWIFYPTEIEVLVSETGGKWTPLGKVEVDVPKDDYTIQHRDFTVNGRATGQYVKVIAHGMDSIPAWHLGAGGKPWIFVDEVMVD